MPFGYYFSYFVVLSRCVLAIVWLGLVCRCIAKSPQDADCPVFKPRRAANA